MQEQQSPNSRFDSPEAANAQSAYGEFTETDAQAVAIQALEERAASTTKLLNYVAAFSIVNSALHIFKIPFGMAFGLCVTRIIDAVSNYTVTGLLINLIPVGFYFLLAFLMKKNWIWFVVGMVFYLLDGLMALVYLLDKNIISFLIALAVHGYVLYVLWQGMTASRAANNLRTMPSGPSR